MCPAGTTILGDVLIATLRAIVDPVFVAPCEFIRDVFYLCEQVVRIGEAASPDDAKGLLIFLAEQFAFAGWLWLCT